MFGDRLPEYSGPDENEIGTVSPRTSLELDSQGRVAMRASAAVSAFHEASRFKDSKVPPDGGHRGSELLGELIQGRELNLMQMLLNPFLTLF